MAELLALTGRHLRTSVRSRAARAAVVAFALGLVLAALTGGDMPSASLLLIAALFVVLLVVTGFAVGAGTVLPDDRVAGREAWLATLAPPAWKRRLSVVLAGWLLAVGIGLVGGALAGGVATLVRDDLSLRGWQPVPLPATRMLGGAEPVEIHLPPVAAGHGEIELEVRPLIRGLQLIDVAEILWTTDLTTGSLRVPVRGPVRFTPPVGTRQVSLALLTPGVRMRIVEARRLGPARSPIPTLAWVGLLLGLCAGTVAPVAVLLSRATSGQTAAAGAFSLLMLGSVKDGMRDLAARLEPEGLHALVPAALEAFAFLAPEAPILEILVEATAQRAPPLGALGSVLPALGYTLLVAVLASVPAPAPLRVGVNT